MNEKKYILTDETINFLNRTLHRIQAVKDFGNVKEGDLGGWIESEENLSQEGTCWVRDEARVFDKAYVGDEARVFDKAYVGGEAEVFDKAWIYGEARVFDKALISDEAEIFCKARVSGEARVFGKARVCDKAEVFGKARVSGKARVFGKARVGDEAMVFGKARVYDEAEVFGKAVITGTTTLRTTAYVQSQYDFLAVEGIGSRNDTTTFYKTKTGGIDVACGCFRGSIEEFEKAVNKTHGDNEHGRVYRNVIRCAKSSLFGIHYAKLKNAIRFSLWKLPEYIRRSN